MKMTIEITQNNEIKVIKNNCYYLIKQENDCFMIYVKYNDDKQLYCVEDVETIVEALKKVNQGYIDVCHYTIRGE